MKYTYTGHSIFRSIDDVQDPSSFDRLNFGFSPAEYSKFKFGDKDIARKFGYELARNFIQSRVFKEIMDAMSLEPKKFVIMSSPYCFIPTATWSMTNYFVQFFNQYLVDINRPVAEIAKIHRTVTYKEDYGELSAEKRMELISKDGFQLDENFLFGKFLIMMDDIKITGSHEKIIERTFKEHSIVNDHLFIYFAELSDASVDPKVENYLNYFYVKNLLSLDKIIKNKTFLPNTRVIKYILNYKEQMEFKSFVNYQSKKTLANIYHLAIGNSYHLIPDYQSNLQYIKELLIEYKYLLK